MAKSNRGRNLRNSSEWKRGQCPICNRTGVKLLWDNQNENGKDTKVCKQCRDK